MCVFMQTAEKNMADFYYLLRIFCTFASSKLLLQREISEEIDLLSKKTILSGREVLGMQNYIIY